MPVLPVLFLAVAILLNASSSVFYKWSSQHIGGAAVWLFAIGVTLGGINAFFYARSLARIRLDIAYPIFSAGSIVLVTLASILVFSEAFSLKQAIGIAVVLAGIALVTSG